MAITNFNTSNRTYRQFMGNGLVYSVPMFQRDYSWTDEEWDDLWQDIVALREPNGETGHYMGYIVLQSTDERHFNVIDGQQRLTTLSLIVLAALNNLNRLVNDGVEPENNRRRIDELRKTYIGFLDPVTLVTSSKLTLNRHNDRYYQTYLVPLEAKLPKRNLRASEHLLRKSFEWFDERIRIDIASSRDGADLARFVDTVADRLFFTVIQVTDELNAYKVFETLNSRGVRLSSTDLLKNYLFSVAHSAGSHEQEMRAIEEQWEAVVGKLGSESVPDFLRVYWNSRNPLTRHAELFKAIRAKVNDKATVFGLLRDLDREADVYAALGEPDAALWTAEQKRYIGDLAMYGVRQSYSLLLAAHRVLGPDDFSRVLRTCSIIAFRYNVIGNLTPNEQERVFNAVAEKITNAGLRQAADIVRSLRPIYPSDAEFRSAFTEKQLRTTTPRNRRVVRHILFAIEHHVSGQGFDPVTDRYSVEHVLPEHPGDHWEAFSDEQADRAVYRLGNMTPLKSADNRAVGNAAFEDKRRVYAESEFAITRQIAENYETWTPERIASRQLWLAKQATAIWRVEGL